MAKRVGKTDDQPFVKLFRELTYRWTPWEVWQDFVTMYACAISNAVDKSHFEKREELYLKRIQKYNKKEQEIFPQLAAEVVLALEKNPEQDFLGSIFMALNLGNDSGGQFFTPYDVCRMMAEMTCDNVLPTIEAKGYISINDCACGAGATLIAGVHAAAKQISKAGLNWQNHILVTAQDVDYTVAYMCYIQLSASRRRRLYQSRQLAYRAHALGRLIGELLVYADVLLRCVDYQKASQGRNALISKYFSGGFYYGNYHNERDPRLQLGESGYAQGRR
ncbi:MAG: N-6 DNA methylase [Faecalibacterium sp.]